MYLEFHPTSYLEADALHLLRGPISTMHDFLRNAVTTKRERATHLSSWFPFLIEKASLTNPNTPTRRHPFSPPFHPSPLTELSFFVLSRGSSRDGRWAWIASHSCEIRSGGSQGKFQGPWCYAGITTVTCAELHSGHQRL